mgnify:CR=1 FL=1
MKLNGNIAFSLFISILIQEVMLNFTETLRSIIKIMIYIQMKLLESEIMDLMFKVKEKKYIMLL